MFFKEVSFSEFGLLNNFTIHTLQNSFKINAIFGCLISKKISDHIQLNGANSIDLSDSPNPEIVFNLFQIFNTLPFYFTDYDTISLIQIFLYLRVNLSKFMSILLSYDQIQQCLSSPLLYVTNETEMLTLLVNKICENQENLELLKYTLFGACDPQCLNQLINSTQYKDINQTSFEYFKQVFQENFVASEHLSDCQIDFETLFSFSKGDEKVEDIFHIPLFASILPNSIRIETDKSSLFLTANQKKILRKFKQISFSNRDFERFNFLSDFENGAVIMIPNCVKTLPENCFSIFSELQEINLENIEEIRKDCFYYCRKLEKNSAQKILNLFIKVVLEVALI